MASRPPSTPSSALPADAGDRRWGIGDAAVGFLISVFVASAVGVAVIGATSYETALWSQHGAAAGRAAGQAGGGSSALAAPRLVPMWLLVVLQLPQWAGLVATVVWAGRRKGRGVREDFGVRFERRDVPTGLAVGVLTQVVALPLLYVPILWVLGERDVSAEARALTDRATGFGVVLFVLFAVVGAPIVEELFFRGLLLRAFERSFGTAVAVVASSVLFGLVHFQLLQFPALLLFGLVAAVLTVRSGRLGPAIWAHVGFNATTTVLLLALR
jgi:membrane protease YdiL (CAAX protease family)